MVSVALKLEPANTSVLLLWPFVRLNVFGRFAFGGFGPFSEYENEVFVGSGDGSVTFLITSVPQLEMLTAIGAMKSFNSAGNDAEERLFRNAAPKCWHTVCEKTPAAVRLMPASPKVRPGRSEPPDGGGLASCTVPALTAPSAKPAADRSTRLPQHGSEFDERHWLVAPLVTHLSSPNTGLPPPLVKSNVISMSPAVRTGVTPFALGVEFWLNSKSMFAEPSTFERSHARYR